MMLAGGRVQTTAETGECCTLLYAIGKLIGSCLHGDTVEVERFNSIIKNECQRSSHLSHELLNARCRLRGELGVGGNGFSHRWSKIRGRLGEVLNVALEGSKTQHYQSMLQGLDQCDSDSSRFAPPPPARHHLVNVSMMCSQCVNIV
jgi:hypothetical protein